MASVDPLDKETLVRILVEPKNALTKQYAKFLSLDKVELVFTPDALEAAAERAAPGWSDPHAQPGSPGPHRLTGWAR